MNTAVLELVPVTLQHKLALGRGKALLQALLGVSIPEAWPHFPEAFALRDDAEEQAPSPLWPAYFFVCLKAKSLVGNGGFAAPPDEQGEVEIGYEIAPAFQKKGYATAAANQMAELAFSRAEVSAVVAHTLASENASNAVLKKIGMVKVAELPDPELGTIWRWRVQRSGAESP